MDKCPHCGSNNIGKVVTAENSSYGLVEFDTTKESVELDKVLVVNVLGCEDCNSLFLISPGLEKV